MTADASDPPRGNRQPRHGGRARAGRAAAVERPHVHHARGARSGRGAAAELAAAAHQRRPSAHQRIPASTASRCCSRSRARWRIFPVIDAIQEFKIESNSPPAEFGRFNGGVVNLTTKAGTNAFHGDGFEFFRNEALNARNFFQSASRGEAGVPAQPVRRHARRAGRAGPHVLLRGLSGPATVHRPHRDLDRADACCSGRGSSPRRSPGGCRSSTTRRRPPVGTRTRFPDNTIPLDRMDPVALGAAAAVSGASRRPARPTTTAGPRDEIDDQDQWDARLDHSFGSNRDQVFGRLSNFRDRFVPVTPLPDGSGVTTGTLGPQDTTAWAFASNYQHTFSPTLLNELRIGDTRRTVGRDAAQLSTSAGIGAQHSRHSVDRQVPQHAADVSHRRLPAARLAAEHGVGLQHERHGGRRLADLAEGAPHAQDGARLALGAARTSSSRRRRPDRSRSTRSAATCRASPTPGRRSRASCSARCRLFSIDLQQSPIQERAQLPGVLHPGRLEGLRSPHDQSGPALHAELPVDRDQRPDGRLQPADASSSSTPAPIRCGR